MKKQIIATAIILPLLGISSMVSADFDCSTLDRDDVMEVLEKQKDGESLTTTEETFLVNAKACMPERDQKRNGSGEKMGDRADMTDEEKAEMKEMHIFIQKQRDGETLTAAEQTQLDAFQEKRGNIGENKKQGNLKENATKNKKTYAGLNDSYKNKLDVVFNKILTNISSYSDSKKISTLEALDTKISKLKTKVDNSSSYSDSKKSIYNSIFIYLEDKIEEEVDDIFDSIFD